jgi:hypothetical protein
MPWGAAAAVFGGVMQYESSKNASDAQDRAIDANAYQGEIAKDQWNSYKTTYQPLEQKMVADATNYDTPAARNAAAAEAQAGVSSELGKAEDRLSRTVGFDPSSAAAQVAQTNLNLQGAAMGATAQNTARKQVKDTAYAHQLDALGLGKGLVANATTGMANAANSASRIAANEQANGTALGSAAGNLIGGLSKVDWNKFGFGSSPGNGMSNANMYSGGNDGYTLPNGESMGT